MASTSGSSTLRRKGLFSMQPGCVVFAKMNCKPWPGLIVEENQIGQAAPKPGHMWIFWFGDYRVSQIPISDIFGFDRVFTKHMETFRVQNKSLKWEIGFTEALREFGHPVTNYLTKDELIKWGKGSFFGAPHPDNRKLSEFVIQKLDSLKEKKLRVDNKTMKEKPVPTKKQKAFLRQISKGRQSLSSICISCYSDEVVEDHPTFFGSVCEPCKDKIKVTMYVAGEDGIRIFCSICACVGTVFICDSFLCNRVFCKKCITDLGSLAANIEIATQSPWRCFVCDPNQSIAGQIRVRENWRENISRLYTTENTSAITPPNIPETKTKLRVLALFDGIATGLHVLQSLHLKVEEYFSCEIDENCMAVTKKNFSQITYLGSIENLSEEALRGIGPIDLVIGGSPCNDLSLVNPARKGPYDPNGTGILFFEYVRVMQSLRFVNTRNFFWLFENVASMPIKYKEIISRFLGCEPRLIDAGIMSGQSRPRLFWGNLPTLSDMLFQDYGVSLQDHLDRDRVAIVEKLQTVTTRGNSLKQGPTMKLPVMDLNTKTMEVVSINELERCFGFPTDYTNVDGLSKTARQQLLGRAWSVPVIESLFRFLTDYFETTE